jgi:hypothetical protein
MGVAVAAGDVVAGAFFPTLATSSGGRLLLLAALVTLGLAVYVAALQILGVARLKDLFAALRG